MVILVYWWIATGMAGSKGAGRPMRLGQGNRSHAAWT
jgi:hypothetical protein